MQRSLAFLLVAWLMQALSVLAAPASDTPAPPAAVPAVPPAPMRIALLLPLNSPVFGQAASMVRNGFMTAYAAQSGGQPVTVALFPTGDQPEEILTAYRQAAQGGTRVVVGPLTRNAVSLVAESGEVTVPTLALNAPERAVALPDKLFVFGLAVETDARQAARMAYTDGRRSAAIAASENALGRRMQQAFQEEWQALGGKIALVLDAGGNQATLRERVENSGADMVFLAADAEKARLIRPYLSNQLPTYATSQVNAARDEPEKNIDLTGVRFADMPWLLQPDHAAVMVYKRPQTTVSVEQERFYALGIDAFRLATLLAEHGDSITLDGVTGMVHQEGHQFQRELMPAQFRQGAAVPLENDSQ